MLFRSRCLALFLTLAFAWSSQAKPEMHTRTFKVPADFLAVEGGPAGGAPAAAPADPFAAGDPSPQASILHRITAKEILEAVGVTFPEGARATFNPATGLLSITNTQSNLDLVATFVETISAQSPKNVACTVTVVEGPGELIRNANAAASRTTNASQELATLLGYAKNPGSNVRIVGDAFLETKSGTRATVEAIREHIYASDLEMDAKSRSSVIQEMRPVGLRLEYEPTLDSEGLRIESSVSLEIHPAPPTERQVSISEPVSGGSAEFPTTEIHSAHFVTGITSLSGDAKLIGITKPVGTPQQSEDILWAAFLTTTVRRVESLLSSASATAISNTPMPSGLKAAAFHVPDGLFESFMERPLPLQVWFEANGITPVQGAAATHTGQRLEIINTPDNVERIASLIDECLRMQPTTVAFTLQTIEAPAMFLRDFTSKTTITADDTAMRIAVEDAATRGEARFINSIFLETKSGTRATHESQREHVYLSEFGTDAKGRPHLAFEMRQVGSILEIEPTVGADGRTIEISFAYELHPAAPEERRGHFRDPASNKAFEMPVIDFHSAKTTTGISVTKGGTKLIALNKPTGRGDADVLWATFLKCDLVTQVSKPQPPPVETKRAAPIAPEGWNTRTYHIPPDFIADGAAPAGPGVIQRKSAKMILEAQGISFPEGATASFNPATSVLFVKNTNENLLLVDEFIASITRSFPKLVTFTTHVLQGPGPLLRRLTAHAASKSDHRAELDELLDAVKAGTVQHLNTARIETKSGARATSSQASEHIAITDVSVNDKGEPAFEQEMREVGLRIELEPTVGADGVTVELTLAPEFHTAPPLEHREFVIDTQGRRLEFPLTDYFVSKTTTGITMPDGTTRLLSLYKPVGKPEFEKEDILQVIFITCDILRVGE